MAHSQITLGEKQVGRMGFGLMSLTWTSNPVPDDKCFAVMKAAADAGSTAWSSATFYGPPNDTFANVKLIRRFFDKYPEYKDKVTIVLKGGLTSTFQFHATVEELRQEVKEAADILGDKKIDSFSYARIPLNLTVEQAFKTLKTLKEEGLFVSVAASEMKAESLAIALKITPISVIEIEVSLYSHAKEIKDVLEWSKAEHVPVLCYSPLGRGLMTRKWSDPSEIPAGEVQGHIPYFQGEAFFANLKLVEVIEKIAEQKSVTTAQVALAWILSQSDYTVPIPGTSRAEKVHENVGALEVTLSADEHGEIDRFLETFELAGGRAAAAQAPMMMR